MFLWGRSVLIEPNNFSLSQETLHILCSAKVYFLFRKTLLLVSNLNQINLVQNIQCCLSRMHFIFIPTSAADIFEAISFVQFL